MGLSSHIFDVMGVPLKWLVYFVENPIQKWMITIGVSPILGKLQMSTTVRCVDSHSASSRVPKGEKDHERRGFQSKQEMDDFI